MAIVDRINLLDKENILGLKTLGSASNKDLVNTAPGVSKIITATGGDLEKGIDKIIKAPSTDALEKVVGAVTGGSLDKGTAKTVGGVIGAIDQDNIINKYFHGFSAAKSTFKQLGQNCLKDLLGSFDCTRGKIQTGAKNKYMNADGCSIDAMSDLLSKYNDQYRPKQVDPCASSSLLKQVTGKAANMGFGEVFSAMAPAFDPMTGVNAGIGLVKDNASDFDLMDDIAGTSYASYIGAGTPGILSKLTSSLSKPEEVTGVTRKNFDTRVVGILDDYDEDWDTNNGMYSTAKIQGANATTKQSFTNISRSNNFSLSGLLDNPTSASSQWNDSSASTLFSFL